MEHRFLVNFLSLCWKFHSRKAFPSNPRNHTITCTNWTIANDNLNLPLHQVRRFCLAARRVREDPETQYAVLKQLYNEYVSIYGKYATTTGIQVQSDHDTRIIFFKPTIAVSDTEPIAYIVWYRSLAHNSFTVAIQSSKYSRMAIVHWINDSLWHLLLKS